ncbi:uncharacterized protein N7458_010912 [Penicillium daleae]|uniref:Uncharacterized protein n=1 Tax=Penicillium daleae TaxID=63821 RepID=A0AAD6C2I9_9EURO|nr:uncharacterized protein N7458_010912 [Penicillium daleae]KAJ5439914.1 hypothetical protein N7458_010912 [Penicillium daleae]
MAGGEFVFENEWIFPDPHGPRTLAGELSLIGEFQRGARCTAYCPSESQLESQTRCTTRLALTGSPGSWWRS